ncbi:hypothetical protein DFH27DRAFT_557171 [Peziza echinospora]|nr:hypothetical protein DFH27DRAFT_557171 [Peziza echinospora]
MTVPMVINVAFHSIPPSNFPFPARHLLHVSFLFSDLFLIFLLLPSLRFLFYHHLFRYYLLLLAIYLDFKLSYIMSFLFLFL